MDSSCLENVEVKIIDAKKNRSLVAKKGFVKDEVLFTEKPFVCSQFSWNKFYQYKACDHCMRPLETAQENVCRLAEDSSIKLPYLKECCQTNKSQHCACANCGVEYCCRECLELALNTYHQVMCLGSERFNPNMPMNLLIDVWKQIHLPPETTTIELILKMLATMKQAGNKQEFMQKLSNLESNVFNQQDQIPHKLLNEKYFAELEGLRELTLELFNNQLHVKECEPWLTREGFRQLFGLIGRNSQGIGSSPLSVWVENCDNLKTISKSEHKKLDKFIDKIYNKLEKTCGSFLNSEGAGLYELQSMINHSCRPNAEIRFQNNNHELSIVALEDIKSNQEILISYLDECELKRSRHSRQKALRENYLFNCECERCESEKNQPDETSDEELEEEYETDEDEEEEKEEDDEKKEKITENNEEMQN